MNRVIAGLVDEPEHYRWPNARECEYAGIMWCINCRVRDTRAAAVGMVIKAR